MLIMTVAVADENRELPPAPRAFIADMARKHAFEQNALIRLFQQVSPQPTILERIAKPAEAKPWHVYRKIFLTEARIQNGAVFWREHAQVLSWLQDRYGVPAEIIVAILGVETGYGQNTGGFGVLEALYTLAFEYPKRADFFRAELEAFLLLCREENVDPLQPKGSYAGAMGLPQFMPSSYRRYAVDFDGDGRRDIWRDANDAAASVANYFTAHGWRAGESITLPATVAGNGHGALLDGDLKPHHPWSALQAGGIQTTVDLALGTPVKLLALEQPDSVGYQLALHNFYVITRYNHSPLYAMAVYELGQAIKTRL
ncbi:MAG: lytic murein transglycosylase B [Methylococcaceae bacterium]|nr:MAG: lytic murein transglycosylase B [Methylococcaceae bacterium]